MKIVRLNGKKGKIKGAINENIKTKGSENKNRKTKVQKIKIV